MREGIIRIDLQDAFEEIADVGAGAVTQQRYRRMMPHQRMVRVAAKRLSKHHQRILVPVRLVVHRGKLHGDLRIAGQMPCLLDFVDRPVDLVRIARPDLVAVPQQTLRNEVPGAAPKPLARAVVTRRGRPVGRAARTRPRAPSVV